LWMMQSSAIEDLSLLGEDSRPPRGLSECESLIDEYESAVGELLMIHKLFLRLGRLQPRDPIDIVLGTDIEQDLILHSLELRLNSECDPVIMGTRDESELTEIEARMEALRAFIRNAKTEK
jgi:hypothetical protein